MDMLQHEDYTMRYTLGAALAALLASTSLASADVILTFGQSANTRQSLPLRMVLRLQRH